MLFIKIMHEKPTKKLNKRRKSMDYSSTPLPLQVGKWEMEKKILVDASDGVLLDLGRVTGVSPPLTLCVVSY